MICSQATKQRLDGAERVGSGRMGLSTRALSAAIACLALIATVIPERAAAYSVLSHQAIIDAAWEEGIKPALLKKFPHATPEELSAAQAYAYGGAIIQDLGYYPYGNPFFSDLTHYVRSGDFILALLHDATDIYEYGFALGALAHYAADNNGHRLGTNRAVAMLYPKLKKKYGDSVTFEDDRLAHVKTEFSFDVLEVAKERYAPEGYHDFIGFEVAPELLERAFRETYGLELKTVLLNQEKALTSYRRAVSKLLPKVTRIAWHLKKDEIKDDVPGITKRKFLYNLKKSNFEREWGKEYKKPSAAEKFLAFLYRLLPKFGPLKVLEFKTPTPETERVFEESFNTTMDKYRELLRQEIAGNPTLPNDNFDVGGATGPGKYKLNDETHARLLGKLAEGKFAGLPLETREELIEFFAVAEAPYATKTDQKAWAKVQAELGRLKALGSAAAHPSMD